MEGGKRSPMDEGKRSPMDGGKRAPIEGGRRSPMEGGKRSLMDEGKRSPREEEKKPSRDGSRFGQPNLTGDLEYNSHNYITRTQVLQRIPAVVSFPSEDFLLKSESRYSFNDAEASCDPIM